MYLNKVKQSEIRGFMALNFRRKRYYFFDHKGMYKKCGKGWSGVVYGVCPVQGDGEIKGHTWYFRSRGERWSFEIYGYPEAKTTEAYGAFPDAGYMKHSEAWDIIIKLIKRHIDSIKKGIKSDTSNRSV